MRITINGKRAEMAMHRYIDPERWDDKAKTVKGTKKEIRLLNEFFDLHRSKVYKAQLELLEEGKHILRQKDSEWLKDFEKYCNTEIK